MSFHNPNLPLQMAEVNPAMVAEMAAEAVHAMPPYVKQTPVKVWRHTLDSGDQQTVYFKDETEQLGHNFKCRGAAYAVGQYAALGAEAVLTASRGNFGMELARAALYYGLDATVVVPEDAEDVKKEAITKLGADLVEVRGDYSDSETVARRLAGQKEMQYVHAAADPYVVAGQGTLAYELLLQLPELTQLVLPVGGVGLLSGAGSVLKYVNPEALVLGVQPCGADAFLRSFKQGRVVEPDTVDSRFGGLAVRSLDPHVFDLGRQVTTAGVQVCNNAVFKTVHDYRKTSGGTLLEAAGATGLAACRTLASGSSPNEVVATVLTGSNASPEFGEYVEELADTHGWGG